MKPVTYTDHNSGAKIKANWLTGVTYLRTADRFILIGSEAPPTILTMCMVADASNKKQYTFNFNLN